jgi:hypothetical protein
MLVDLPGTVVDLNRNHWSISAGMVVDLARNPHLTPDCLELVSYLAEIRTILEFALTCGTVPPG